MGLFPSPGSHASIGFDANGPRVEGRALLAKTKAGFVALDRPALAKLLGGSIDIDRLHPALASIARHLNSGDLALAGIATALLPPIAHRRDAAAVPIMAKAAADDPDHPGYPADAPDGKGGQFRPKDGANTSGGMSHLRLFQAALGRVFSGKRMVRLVAKNLLAATTEEIPVLDVLTTASAIEEDAKVVEDLAAAIKEFKTGSKLLEAGPQELENILVDTNQQTFQNFAALKKEDISKFYGPAGEGLEYHHIVEQSQTGEQISAQRLNSTDNIIKLPRLIHQQVSAYYSRNMKIEELITTPRNYLRGKSYDYQRQFGLDVLRKIGAIK